MPYRGTDPPVLSERELEAWWNDPKRERPYDTDARLGDGLCDVEDEILFLVGTLCVLNGQRALWCAIYSVALDNPAHEAFEFLERMTRQARRSEIRDVPAA